jgi:hypothetical protein
MDKENIRLDVKAINRVIDIMRKEGCKPEFTQYMLGLRNKYTDKYISDDGQVYIKGDKL